MGPQPAVSAGSGPLRPIAMVSLDGGGVRGLSSLIILRLLLILVEGELVNRQVIPEDGLGLNPQDIFDIAVGTSTGGLIVLMMVKLNMSLDECIEQYKILSADIFSKQRPILKRIFGSDWSKFSGKRLQKAIEKLLASRRQPHDLKLRGSSQPNGMQGTVLCHERPNLHPVFFCTHECQGPYRQHALDCDLELRQAARATAAAPTFFEPVIIKGRSFVDGGYGETNNPSWEGKLHYHKNHGLGEEQHLVMVNIGTGTLPADLHPDRLPTRPLWTKVLPNSIVEAMGLVSDLAKMATESEQRAIDLSYISSIIPEQFFFDRFSADTGLHDIQLDNWQAAREHDGPSVIEAKTNAYLEKPEVRARLETAAKKLADIYVTRTNSVVVVSSSAAEDQARVDLSISLGINGTIPEHAGMIKRRTELLTPAAAGERAPSLVSTDPTRSPDPSPPPTPEPGRTTLLQSIVAVDAHEVLQGEGGQFDSKNAVLDPLFSPTPKPKRASTYS